MDDGFLKIEYTEGSRLKLVQEFPIYRLDTAIENIYNFLRALGFTDEMLKQYIDVYGEIESEEEEEIN